MQTIQIPYYTSTLDLHVEEKNLLQVVTAKMHEYDPGKSEVELIREALEHPIGTPRLRELAKGKHKVVLVTSDHTRAVPSKLTLPILLEEIRSGNPDADITILIATGLHRPTTEEEQRRMFGDAIVDHEKIAINNAFDPTQFTHVCTLPSGADFNVNKLATECDLLITEGFIEPHFFAGFSGGRKSILPGICSQETVNENHSYKAISSPYANTGVLEHNPIHEDMVCAARAVNVQFIFNVALNGEKKVIAAWAGDLEQAHASPSSGNGASVPASPVTSLLPATAAIPWTRTCTRVPRPWPLRRPAPGRTALSSCAAPAPTAWAAPTSPSSSKWAPWTRSTAIFPKSPPRRPSRSSGARKFMPAS